MSADSVKCRSCHTNKEKLEESQKTCELLQKRFRGVVQACKQAQEQLKEKDQQLLASSIAATANLYDVEHQERIVELEANVSDLSRISGEYESERRQHLLLIEQLRSELKSIRNDRDAASPGPSYKEPPKSFDQHINLVLITRNRSVQTDAIEQSPEESEKKDSNAKQGKKIYADFECQVELEARCPTPLQAKKGELAIVLPTQREEVFEDEFPSHSSGGAFQPYPRHRESSGARSPHSPGPFTPLERSFNSRSRTISESAQSVSGAGGPSNSGVSIFYANELARKEIDLAEARLQAREFECALRELQWKYNVDKYR